MKKETILCLCINIFLLLFLSITAYAECLVIVNNSVTETTISKEDVSRIFLGKKKKWSNESKIDPVILKEGERHEEFTKEYVNKTSGSFSAYWKREIVAGTGIPPKSFASEPDLVKFVSENPGTIGYISPGTPHAGVKVLSVK